MFPNCPKLELFGLDLGALGAVLCHQCHGWEIPRPNGGFHGKYSKFDDTGGRRGLRIEGWDQLDKSGGWSSWRNHRFCGFQWLAILQSGTADTSFPFLRDRGCEFDAILRASLGLWVFESLQGLALLLKSIFKSTSVEFFSKQSFKMI